MTKIQDFPLKNGLPLNFDASNIGVRPFIYEVETREAMDINIQKDYEMAEFMLSYIHNQKEGNNEI